MKALIPAAGLGTRLLPVTKVVPKELLPVKGKPAIQWVLEEAFVAGLREFIVVISERKNILRDYLTPLGEDSPLRANPRLIEFEQLLRNVAIRFVEQPAPLGLGDAILRCRHLLGEEAFALLLPDNVCTEETRLVERLIALHHDKKKSCLGIRRATGVDLVDGAIMAHRLEASVHRVTEVLRKGSANGHAADLRGIGRYVLDSIFFDLLEQAQGLGESDEAHALNCLASKGQLLGWLETETFLHIGAGLG